MKHDDIPRDTKKVSLPLDNHYQGGDGESTVNDNNDEENFKIESAQPVSDTFCEPVPELSRKLQLEHHQCVRLLKAVHGLVNAPRRRCHRVATDLRNMGGEEFHGNLLVCFS